MERLELKKFREKKKITQENMAERLEISYSFYKQLENGYKNPSIKLLKKFRSVFPDGNIVKFFLD